MGARPLRARDGRMRFVPIPGSMRDDAESRNAGALIVNPLHGRIAFPFEQLLLSLGARQPRRRRVAKDEPPPPSGGARGYEPSLPLATVAERLAQRVPTGGIDAGSVQDALGLRSRTWRSGR